jgi:ferredoxin-NADP reductase
MITNNDWVEAQVLEKIVETPEVTSLILKPDTFLEHKAGQHYELRLTSEDGYEAARPYSAAPTTGPAGTLQLTIQHVPNGEVSSYVHQDLKVGDKVDIRGPFGRFFVWDETDTMPILLIGGGSGIVPLGSILDAHQQSGSKVPMRLLYSAHTYEDIIYKKLFVGNPTVDITLSRDAPDEWHGHVGRLTPGLVESILQQFPTSPICYVCGMSPFVSAVNEALRTLGVPAASIKTERFG